MITYRMPETGALEQRLWETSQRLNAGELFGLQLSHTFERENMLGLAREELRIQEAESAAGTADPHFTQLQQVQSELGFVAQHAHALSEDEYKASEWYRKRPDGKAAIEYSPNMTPQRAQILAEVYDRRRKEEQLIAQSADTTGRKAMLFGASFLASLPDPINFIPLAGSLGKGASLGRRIARGALEGAAGAALTDAVVYPLANKRGEDFGFLDAAMDITFGALIGGGMGGIGGAIAIRRERKINAEIEATGRELERTLIEDVGLAPEDAARAARETVTSLQSMPDSLGAARALRKSIGGEDRAAMADTLEKALLDVSRGDAADVRLNASAASEDFSLNGYTIRGAGSIEVNGHRLAEIIKSGDSRAAAPLADYRAPEPPQGVDAEMRAWGIDPTDGRSLDEVEALRLIEEGRADPESIAELDMARMENERVTTREDAALSIAACIAGAV